MLCVPAGGRKRILACIYFKFNTHSTFIHNINPCRLKVLAWLINVPDPVMMPSKMFLAVLIACTAPAAFAMDMQVWLCQWMDLHLHLHLPSRTEAHALLVSWHCSLQLLWPFEKCGCRKSMYMRKLNLWLRIWPNTLLLVYNLAFRRPFVNNMIFLVLGNDLQGILRFKVKLMSLKVGIRITLEYV